MAEGTRLDYRIIAQPYTPDDSEYIAVIWPVWTSTQLADPTHRVNVKDKFRGKRAWDSVLNEPVYASGPLAADAWEVMAVMLARDASAAILQPSATTAELAAIGDAINTANMRQGKIVLNTTSNILVFADGPAAGDTRSGVHDNLVDHTPI